MATSFVEVFLWRCKFRQGRTSLSLGPPPKPLILDILPSPTASSSGRPPSLDKLDDQLSRVGSFHMGHQCCIRPTEVHGLVCEWKESKARHTRALEAESTIDPPHSPASWKGAFLTDFD